MRYLKRKRVENAGHPKGFWGRWTMRAMNKDHDALTDWGLSYLTVNGEEKILDVGCGGGKTVKKLAQATCNTVWGADISATAVNEAFHTNKKAVKSGHVMICKAGVFSLPFDNDTFDIVTAVETVYFWPDLEAALKEIYRVMVKDGQLMILTDARADGPHPEKIAEVAEHIHLRLPSANSLADAMRKAGFKGVTAYIRDDALCMIGKKS